MEDGELGSLTPGKSWDCAPVTSALELQAFEVGNTRLAFSTALRRAHKRLKSFTLYTNPAAAPPDPSFS